MSENSNSRHLLLTYSQHLCSALVLLLYFNIPHNIYCLQVRVLLHNDKAATVCDFTGASVQSESSILGRPGCTGDARGGLERAHENER